MGSSSKDADAGGSLEVRETMYCGLIWATPAVCDLLGVESSESGACLLASDIECCCAVLFCCCCAVATLYRCDEM